MSYTKTSLKRSIFFNSFVDGISWLALFFLMLGLPVGLTVGLVIDKVELIGGEVIVGFSSKFL